MVSQTCSWCTPPTVSHSESRFPEPLFCTVLPRLNVQLTSSPAPTALSNGVTMIETQADWVISAIEKLERENIRSFEATIAAEDDWMAIIEDLNKDTLYPLTNSWWNKANLPGRKAQMLTHPGGIEMYESQCREKLDIWEGFDLVYEQDA